MGDFRGAILVSGFGERFNRRFNGRRFWWITVLVSGFGERFWWVAVFMSGFRDDCRGAVFVGGFDKRFW